MIKKTISKVEKEALPVREQVIKSSNTYITKVVVLDILKRASRSGETMIKGWDVLKALREIRGKVSQGTFYRILYSMQRDGLIAAEEGKKSESKKHMYKSVYYDVTEKGLRKLEEMESELAKVLKVLMRPDESKFRK